MEVYVLLNSYSSHKTFHAGDSGLDLFVVKEQTIQPGETAFIRLGIKAAAFDGKDGGRVAQELSVSVMFPSAGLSWLLMARSSISKTPLRLSNSIGLIDQVDLRSVPNYSFYRDTEERS